MSRNKREPKEKLKIIFSERESYISDFNNQINFLESTKRSIYNLYGVGGIGKTSLLAQFKIIARSRNINILEIDFNDTKTIDDFYFHLYRQLDKKSIHAVYFSLAYIIYYKKLHPLVSIKEIIPVLIQEGGAIAEIVDVFTKFGDEYLGALGSALKVMHKGYKKVVEITMLDKEILLAIKNLYNEDKESVQKQLMEFLSDDLKILAKEKERDKTLFLFDTYEKNKNIELEEEILDFIKILDDTKSMFIISGRQCLNWEDKDLIKKEVISFRVGECKSILSKNGIKEDDIIDAISKSSRGVGFYLELAIRIYHRTNNKNVEYYRGLTFKEIFERFIENHKEYKDDLERLAFPRYFHFNIYTILTGKGEMLFNDFIESDFIFSEDGKYFMHDLMCDHIKNEVSETRANKLHQEIFQYYNSEINKYTIVSNHIESKYYIEALYHLNEYGNIEKTKVWFESTELLLVELREYSLLTDLYKMTMLKNNDLYVNRLFEFWITNKSEYKLANLHLGSFLITYYYNNYITKYKISDIEEKTLQWLQVYGGHYIASFVMNSYLKANTTKGKLIKKSLRGWLASNKNSLEQVAYLLSSYLNKGDTHLSDINDYIMEYDKNNISAKVFKLLMWSYFKKNGKLELMLNTEKKEEVLLLYAHVNYIFRLKNKKYEEYIVPYITRYEDCILKYRMDYNKNDVIEYLFICSKYMKVSNKNLKIVNKIIDEYEEYILNNIYFNDNNYMFEFNIYDEYEEFNMQNYNRNCLENVLLKSIKDYEYFILNKYKKENYKNYFLICLRYEKKNVLNENIMFKMHKNYEIFLLDKIPSIKIVHSDTLYFLKITSQYLSSSFDKNKIFLSQFQTMIDKLDITQAKENFVIEYGKTLKAMQENKLTIPLTNIVYIMKTYSRQYTQFLKIYLNDDQSSEVTSRKLLLEFLSRNPKTQSQIKNNIIPVFDNYLDNFKDSRLLESEMKDILTLGLEHEESGRIIVLFIYYGGSISSIKKLLDRYMEIHSTLGVDLIFNYIELYKKEKNVLPKEINTLIQYFNQYK